MKRAVTGIGAALGATPLCAERPRTCAKSGPDPWPRLPWVVQRYVMTYLGAVDLGSLYWCAPGVVVRHLRMLRVCRLVSADMGQRYVEDADASGSSWDGGDDSEGSGDDGDDDDERGDEEKKRDRKTGPRDIDLGAKLVLALSQSVHHLAVHTPVLPAEELRGLVRETRALVKRNGATLRRVNLDRGLMLDGEIVGALGCCPLLENLSLTTYAHTHVRRALERAQSAQPHVRHLTLAVFPHAPMLATRWRLETLVVARPIFPLQVALILDALQHLTALHCTFGPWRAAAYRRPHPEASRTATGPMIPCLAVFRCRACYRGFRGPVRASGRSP